VFIAHGTQDPRAPIAQAIALKHVLWKHDKPYVWFAKRAEPHRFFSTQDRTDYVNSVLEFLGSCGAESTHPK